MYYSNKHQQEVRAVMFALSLGAFLVLTLTTAFFAV